MKSLFDIEVITKAIEDIENYEPPTGLQPAPPKVMLFARVIQRQHPDKTLDEILEPSGYFAPKPIPLEALVP